MATRQSTSEASTQSSSKKKKVPLPDGWITRESRRHKGSFYYFNQNTGKSSWSLPTESPKKQTKRAPDGQDQKPTSSGAKPRPNKSSFGRFKESLSKLVKSVENVKKTQITHLPQEATKPVTSSKKPQLNIPTKAKGKSQGTSSVGKTNLPIKRKQDFDSETRTSAKPVKKRLSDGLSQLQAQYAVTEEGDAEVPRRQVGQTEIQMRQKLKGQRTGQRQTERKRQTKGLSERQGRLSETKQRCDHADKVDRSGSHQPAMASSGAPPQRQKSLTIFSDDVEVPMDVEMVEVEPDEVKGHLNQIRDEMHTWSNLKAKLDSSLPEKVKASHSSSHKDGLYIVLDTNVLISHLRFLEELRDQLLKGFGNPILVIPWVVLQELDGLKTGHDTTGVRSTVAKQAVAAGHFIHNCVKVHHPRVLCQSPQSAMKAEIQIECNDDRILQCCLQYQHMGVGMMVVLFSNDINLCIKTIASGLSAFTKQDLISGLKDLAGSRGADDTKQASNKRKWTIMPKATPTTTTRTEVPQVKPALKNVHQASTVKITKKPVAATKSKVQTKDEDDLADTILCEMKQFLTKGLSTALEKEMKSVYDDQWLDLVLIKPPWNFTDLLRCYQKHWIAVFMMFLHKSDKSYLDEIQNHFRTALGYGTNLKTVQHLVCSSHQFTSKLLQHDKANKVLQTSVSGLAALVERCDKPMKKETQNSQPSPSSSISSKIDVIRKRADMLTRTQGKSSVKSTQIMCKDKQVHKTGVEKDNVATSRLSIYDDGDIDMITEEISVPETSQDVSSASVLQVFQCVGETVFEKSASLLTALHEHIEQPCTARPSRPSSDRHLIERSLVILCSLLLTVVIAMARLLQCSTEPTDNVNSAYQVMCYALDDFTRGCEINPAGCGLNPSSFQQFMSIHSNRETLVNGLKQFAAKLQELHEYIKNVDSNVYMNCQQTLMALVSQILS